MNRVIRKWVMGLAMTFALANIADTAIPQFAMVTDAHAIIGRPLTPGSYAGVARRTTRRVIRRSAIYASTLPAGCLSVMVNGIAIWRCGSVYYQPYGGRYVVVYID